MLKFRIGESIVQISCKKWLLVFILIILNINAFSQAPHIRYTAFSAGGNSNKAVKQVVLASTLLPSIITFPIIQTGSNVSNIIPPGATSTNPETPITYTSSNTSVAIITADEMIQLVGPGVTIITANQAGDANYSPADPAIETLTVMESQEITLPATAAKTTCDADFAVGAVSSNNTIPLTYSSSNPAVAAISASGVMHIVAEGTTTITVSQAGNTLFEPASPQTQVVTVTLPVNPIVTIAADFTSICTGMPVTFSPTITNISGTTNFKYQWQVNGINVSTNPTFTTTTLAATDVVQCIVTNNTSCPTMGASNSLSGINVMPYVTPGVTITSSVTSSVCSGTNIVFTAAATNGGTNPTYQWQVNGIIVNENGPQFSSSTLAGGDQVTCVLINNGGACLTSNSAVSNAITVTIIPPADPAPSVTISAANNNVYPGVPITFTAVSADAGTGLTYQWQVNGQNAGINNVTFTSSSLNNGDVITCILIINDGCIPPVTSNAVVVNIIPPPVVTIPNTFTPNGDGINDLWDIPDLNVYPKCLVSIFTRYGTLIYQSYGYGKAWDGSYKGSQLSTGVFYYVIDLGNKTRNLSGWVAIVR